MKRLFYCICLLAAFCSVWPAVPSSSSPAAPVGDRPLLISDSESYRIISDLEEIPAFGGFPGKIRVARDLHGSGPLLIREVAAPTRALHSSYDCFRGSGYRVDTPKVELDRAGRRWAVFHAERGGERLKVSEIFIDSQGKAWSDISSWYWSAFFKKSHGPWQAITRVEKQDQGAENFFR